MNFRIWLQKIACYGKITHEAKIMIYIKNEEQINGIRKACHLTADMFNELIPKIHAGIDRKSVV